MRLHVVYGSVVLVLLGLIALLVYDGIDTAVTLSYRDEQVHQLEEANKQLMASLPALARNLGKAEVVAALEREGDPSTFEKEGCTWVGWVGLKFSPEEKLIHVSSNGSYGEPDPCHMP